MKIDDPKLTAYALGEVASREKADIEQELASSPDAQAYVTDTRALAGILAAEFHAELHDSAREERNILPLPYGRLFWLERRWPAVAMAALLIGALVLTAVLMWRSETPSKPHFARSRQPAADNDASDSVVVDYGGTGDDAAVGEASRGAESPFIPAAARPMSTFSTAVGTSSFAVVRAFIESGIRPPKSAVRVEEIINYFNYDYPAPAHDQRASLAIDAASCPWSRGHQLVRIGVRFTEATADASLEEFIPRAAVEVRFNPQRVEAYRLIGYDEPVSATAGSRGAGTGATRLQRTVIGLYEIIPAVREQRHAASDSDELLTARVNDADVPHQTFVEQRFSGGADEYEDASDDFRFAAAVAEFGMILRDSPYRGSGDIAAVINWANAAKNSNSQVERTAFVECARKAAALL